MKAIALFVLAAVPLHADTLADLKAAVASLKGAQPIHADVALKRNDKEEGRFTNEEFSGAANVEVAVDAQGVHVVFSPPVVAQLTTEARAHRDNAKKIETTARTAGHVTPVWVLENLNHSDQFLGLLNTAKLRNESRVSLQNRNVRLLVFDVTEKLPESMKSLGSIDYKQNVLRVWVGDDNLPIIAERATEASVRVLFFHGTLKMKDSWTYARFGDHLVVARHDSSNFGDVFGQKNASESSAVITIR